MKPKRVVFLFGGPGAEHEVSLASAKSALPAFDSQFSLKPVFIGQNNTWVVPNDYVSPEFSWDVAESLILQTGVPADIALDTLENDDPYVVFIGLHGTFGEDGTLQSLLEARGIPYTGSNAEASALAMDKPKVLQLLQDEGVMVPEFLEISADTPLKEIQDFVQFHHLPVVVLPAENGSSVGVSIVRDNNALKPAIEKARAHGSRVVVSKYIQGREVSCGVIVMDHTNLVAFPPTELIPAEGHDFFDFEAKYIAGETLEVTPPDLPPHTIAAIQTLAKQVHQLVGADGYSRTDMIVGEDGNIYVLEINTLPGMTATSILPQQAEAYGLTFSQLLTTLCTNVDRSAGDYITATTQLDP